jgi:hypothetical protein
VEWLEHGATEIVKGKDGSLYFVAVRFRPMEDTISGITGIWNTGKLVVRGLRHHRPFRVSVPMATRTMTARVTAVSAATMRVSNMYPPVPM